MYSPGICMQLGKASTSTMKLMQATDQFSKSSNLIKKMFEKHFPGKKLDQAITEYNINYASWKPPFEERQTEGTGAVWVMSVLRNLLYDGVATAAMHWHYAGGNYGVVCGNYEIRPNRTLFYLLNRYLYDAELCKVRSDNSMVEVLAAENKNNYTLVTINKSPATLSIEQNIEALGKINLDKSEEYTIAGKGKSFSPNSTDLRKRFEMRGYSMRFQVLPKN